MEIPALQSHTPLWRRRASTLPPGATHPKFRPALGPFSQSSLCYGGFLSVRFAPRMAASSDYSRRRPRKSLIPKTKSPTPKGFAPRTQVGTSIQKKEQTESEEKGQGSLMYDAPETRKLEVMSGSTMEQPTVPLDGADHKDQTESEEKGQGSLMYDSPETQKLEVMSGSTMEKPTVPLDGADHKDTIDRTYINGDHSVVLQSGGDLREEIASGARSFNSNDTDQVNQKGTIAKIEEYTNLQETPDKFEVDGGDLQKPESVSSSSFSSSSVETGNQVYSMDNDNGTLTIEGNYSVETIDHVIVVEEAEDSEEGAGTHEHDIEDVLAKQKAEEDAQACKRMLEELAERNNLNESKIFIYPEVVKPDQTIAVFFNRNLSALMNEPDVLIMGAFNDWRWKSFTERLQKSDLNGDWWSCQLHVPKEAYKVDFVFFNGGSIYENNDRKDFCIPVEGGMDLYAFEDFLLEEKRRELEKLAAEQAEREREAEEQQRREVENAAREADKAQAKLEAEKKRNALHNVLNIAVLSVDNLWHIVPSNFKGGDRIRIFYSRSSRSLAHAEEIWIHGGHNNWNDGLSIVARLFSSKKEDGDWWYADVVVPDRAIILDWVFADGQPQSAKVYDNNNYQDFHAIVPNKMAEDLFWVEEENEIFKRLQEERRMKEEALRRKTEKTAKLKAETKQKTMKMFLLSQKHIFYTDPLDVQAGSTITVFYNPSNTVLSGKSDVWFRCSFNRWTHRNGPLRPQRMVLAGNGSLVKTSVKVPLDAYMMDFVFSDKEDGGTFDNRNGMDYHIPVSGGLAREPPMHIVHVSVEMAPIAKVGGLGDVVTSLSRAVQDLGHCVDIILPKYDCMNLSNVKDFEFCQSFPWSGCEIKVWFGKVEGLSVYFLEPENGMFSAGCIYGCRNDGERFGFFCHAALEFLHQKGAHPDILHCHDWSSAPVAWLFKEHYKHHTMTNARVIFTIHNLEFGVHQIGKAMLHADKATTVSYTYSKEVSGNPAIAPYHSKFYGILNGIDPDIWDPYNDNYIPVSYTSENVVEGKRAAKEALQQRLGLKKSDHPLVGIISRLTVQKGIHLIKHAICRTLERNGQVVLLGSAPDQRIQNDFVNLANQLHSSHADQVRLCLTYDEPLSHLIYAGSDFILVPSIFEPCGLTQLIAMRYGSIPIVRKTGGLYDTVFDVDNDKGRAEAQGLEPNGFSFDGADSGGVDYALNRAISAWFDGRDWFNQLCKRVMEQDWSWNRPALDYMELYHAARK